MKNAIKNEVILYLTAKTNFDSVRCLHGILFHAYFHGASDVHIDVVDQGSYGSMGLIKMRINGHILHYALCDGTLFQGLLGVIKSRANLRIDLHDRGQDGSFVFYPYRNRGDNRVFIRIAINPTLHGESIVMRIMKQEQNFRLNLNQLGMSGSLIDVVEKYIKLDNSLILISGSTGSGKTTTMYSIIDELNPEKNIIISLEDPVEKHIHNVRQVPIRSQFGFSYSDALKMALRQDPDVIVIGEIRDRETAEIAIEAALTGHLVIAGVHARDPVDVIMRLMQLGVDYFLISQVLSLSIHQSIIYGENVNIRSRVNFNYVDFAGDFSMDSTDSKIQDFNIHSAGVINNRLDINDIKLLKSKIKNGSAPADGNA